MKEDYLWDKTGSDAEIERLENALAAFRYRENAAPALPIAKIAPIKSRSAKIRTYRFASALAAGLLLSMIALGTWFQLQRNRFDTEPSLAERSLQQIEDSANKIAPLIEPHKLVYQTVDNAVRPAPATQPAKERKIAAPIAKSVKFATRKDEPKQPKAELTKEEKYAYDQLMLALSITSDKLKMVKDKAEGKEAESEDFSEKGR